MKTIPITISAETAQQSFMDALRQSHPRGNYFSELRSAFRNRLAAELLNCGVQAFPDGTIYGTPYTKEGMTVTMNPILKLSSYANKPIPLDVNFCARYGHDDYSLAAVNYLDRAYTHIPSLRPFSEIPGFSLGNILLLVQNGDYDVRLVLEGGLDAVGYSYSISSRKKKSYICLFGIRCNMPLAPPPVDPVICPHNAEDLDECRIGIVSYPAVWVCRKCGQLLTCECFAGHYCVQDDLVRFLPYGNSEPVLKKAVDSIIFKPGICHICTGRVPLMQYGSEMYYSTFVQKYLPYYTLWCRKKVGHDLFDGDAAKAIENELRETLGYPRIGEKWITETMLFNTVRSAFSPLQVIQHYRGRELRGLELDVWIPELRLGIEYQGIQHYKPMDHWGGEEGLEKRKANDNMKRALCRDLGYALVEFRYGDSITEDVVAKKLKKYIQKKT